MQNISKRTAIVREYFYKIAKTDAIYIGRVYTDKLRSGLRSVKLEGLYYATKIQAEVAAEKARAATGCDVRAVKRQSCMFKFAATSNPYTIRAYV